MTPRRSVRGRIRVDSRSMRGRIGASFEVELRPLRRPIGVNFGSIWGRCGIALGAIRRRAGVDLGSTLLRSANMLLREKKVSASPLVQNSGGPGSSPRLALAQQRAASAPNRPGQVRPVAGLDVGVLDGVAMPTMGSVRGPCFAQQTCFCERNVSSSISVQNSEVLGSSSWRALAQQRAASAGLDVMACLMACRMAWLSVACRQWEAFVADPDFRQPVQRPNVGAQGSGSDDVTFVHLRIWPRGAFCRMGTGPP